MSALPILTRVLINTTYGNSKIWGNVTLPRAGSAGTVSFGPVSKMLQTKRGSVAKPGDTVIDLGDRFVLGYFSSGVNDDIFRMFRLPYSGEVTRATSERDPVTGFARGGSLGVVGTAWYDCTASGYFDDVEKLKRTKYRIITGFPLQPGDRLKDMTIVAVSTELGVVIAEAE
jgi:hypothetical protein